MTAKLDVVMREEHRAGEKMFVDYAGQTVPVVERDTRELREAQIFVEGSGVARARAANRPERGPGTRENTERANEAG